MTTPRIPECFICPITRQVMTEPFITVDGFSYERRAIENWLLKSGLSPMTGIPLAQKSLIPNENLRQAIQFYFSISGLPRSPTQHPSYFADRGFSRTLLGSSVEVVGERILRRVGTPLVWSDAAAFLEAPLKGYGLSSKVTIDVVKVTSEWGGLLIGVSPTDFRSPTDRARILEETSYRLDSQGWFHHPNDGSVLAGWNSANLAEHDQLTLELPADGRFVVSVNNEKKVDIRDARLPDGPLFAFVALTGSCNEIKLIAP